MSIQKQTIGVFSVILMFLYVILSTPIAGATANNDMNGDGVVKMTVMGDSFSSGVGAPHAKNSPALSSFGSSAVGSSDAGYDPSTTTSANRCFRSEGAYGPIVARDLGYELDFIACSGAKITEMLSTSQYGEPVQTEALSPDTDIVVLTAGGNDVGFVDYVTCVVLEECTGHSPAASRTLGDSVNVLPGLMDQLLMKVRSQAPQARVVVLGYVVGLEPRESVPLIPGGMCFPYFSKSEMELTYQVRDTLNGVIQQSAMRHGVEYVDPHMPGSALNAWEASICNPSYYSASHSVAYDAFSTLDLGRTSHPTAHAHAVQAEMLKAMLVG